MPEDKDKTTTTTTETSTPVKRRPGRPKGVKPTPSARKILGATGEDITEVAMTHGEKQGVKNRTVHKQQTALDIVESGGSVNLQTLGREQTAKAAQELMGRTQMSNAVRSGTIQGGLFGAAQYAIDNGRQSASVLSDGFEAVRLCNLRDPERAHAMNKQIRQIAAEEAVKRVSADYYNLYKRSLLFDAQTDFDAFMQYIEFERPAEERFWLPRREKSMEIVRAMQDLADGKLDELMLSRPPRTGKTTIMEFFLLWMMGKNSEQSNLYCSYTDSVVGAFYNGLVEMLQDKMTYKFYDVFPNAKLVSTNALDKMLNLDRKKRYASFTGRSLYGTLNGACDCDGILIADDLLSGIEEAMSKDRLNTAWTHVDNNLLPRAKENCKILWIGTRWSLMDPQGRRIDLLENDPQYRNRRWKVINTPALDENDESNFNYQYGVGFSTEYYRQRRASFERNNDLASWQAQYQGEPIEREGAVFSPEQLRYYNGELPEGDPDRVFAVVDPAFGGGDAVSAPFIYQYGNDLYVADVVFNFSEKNVTQPLIAEKAIKHKLGALKVEGTKLTSGYGEDLDRMLKDRGMRINTVISATHFTGTGKRQRIFDKAPDIREHMIFLSDGYRSKEYQQFMNNLFSFTITGKEAKHDDAPDSLAMAIDFAFIAPVQAVSVVNSPFRR